MGNEEQKKQEETVVRDPVTPEDEEYKGSIFETAEERRLYLMERRLGLYREVVEQARRNLEVLNKVTELPDKDAKTRAEQYLEVMDEVKTMRDILKKDEAKTK